MSLIFQWEYEDGAKKGSMLAGAEPGQGRVGQKLAEELGPAWDLTTGGYFEGANMLVLLGRLCTVGEGGAMGSKRRQY